MDDFMFLAYAVSIHRSPGLILDKNVLDICTQRFFGHKRIVARTNTCLSLMCKKNCLICYLSRFSILIICWKLTRRNYLFKKKLKLQQFLNLQYTMSGSFWKMLHNFNCSHNLLKILVVVYFSTFSSIAVSFVLDLYTKSYFHLWCDKFSEFLVHKLTCCVLVTNP